MHASSAPVPAATSGAAEPPLPPAEKVSTLPAPPLPGELVSTLPAPRPEEEHPWPEGARVDLVTADLSKDPRWEPD